MYCSMTSSPCMTALKTVSIVLHCAASSILISNCAVVAVDTDVCDSPLTDGSSYRTTSGVNLRSVFIVKCVRTRYVMLYVSCSDALSTNVVGSS